MRFCNGCKFLQSRAGLRAADADCLASMSTIPRTPNRIWQRGKRETNTNATRKWTIALTRLKRSSGHSNSHQFTLPHFGVARMPEEALEAMRINLQAPKIRRKACRTGRGGSWNQRNPRFDLAPMGKLHKFWTPHIWPQNLQGQKSQWSLLNNKPSVLTEGGWTKAIASDLFWLL